MRNVIITITIPEEQFKQDDPDQGVRPDMLLNSLTHEITAGWGMDQAVLTMDYENVPAEVDDATGSH